MRQLQVGDIVLNTNHNWHGTKRVVIGITEYGYVFRILDGNYADRRSSTRFSTAERQFDMRQWSIVYPEHLLLPNGA